MRERNRGERERRMIEPQECGRDEDRLREGRQIDAIGGRVRF